MSLRESTSIRPALLICFVLSGAAALTYEVIWTRMLVDDPNREAADFLELMKAFKADLTLLSDHVSAADDGTEPDRRKPRGETPEEENP